MNELQELAVKLHGSADGHSEFTLTSMKDHVDEIRMLLDRDDAHWKAETVDILIHCLLLLRNAGVGSAELEGLIDRRFERFREKISDALQDKERKMKFRKGVYGQEDSHHR